MFASRWHSPPKPASVLSCTTGTCRCASRSASRLPCTSPSSTPARTPSRPGRPSDALEQRRLARAGRAHQVDDRDAVAVEVVAVGPRDRVVGVERVLDDPDLHAMHAVLLHLDRLDLQLVAARPPRPAAAARRAAERRQLELPLALAAVAAQPRRRPAPARAARPRRRVSRETMPEVERPASPARPGAGARRAAARRSPAARGVPHDGVDDRGADRQLVHQRRPRPCAARRSSRARASSARPTAASTTGVSPMPDVVDLAGSQRDHDDLARPAADRA